MTEFNGQQKEVTLVYVPTYKAQRSKGSPAWTCVQATKAKRSLDTVIMDKATKRRVLDLIEMWSERRQVYIDQGEPYRAGFLFEGPTGTGKQASRLR